jgi:hypothetical protein
MTASRLPAQVTGGHTSGTRAAYAEGGGPHGNWGTASGWLSVQDGTQACEVAEMLATGSTHLQFSPGRLP